MATAVALARPRDWRRNFGDRSKKLADVGELALQLLLWEMSESMGNHDSEVVDASSVD
jgi:hypothetical protein